MGPVAKIIDYGHLPHWSAGSLLPGFAALLKNIHAGPDKSPGWDLSFWNQMALAAQNIAPDDESRIRAFIESHFDAVHVSDEPGLFTGYYQPVVQASREKKPGFETPLYSKPPELIVVEDLGNFRPDLQGIRFAGHMVNGALKPFYTRAEINRGALENRGLELAWCHPIDAFFIAIQGSARLQFEDGSSTSLGYNGANGHIYTAIGKPLLEQGALTKENVSMQSIRQWLLAHPEKMNDIFELNQSYIFFKTQDQAEPFGSHGVTLTPGGSMAVDPRYIPLGSILWLATEQPALHSLVVAQDTGSAIKGPVRGDFYWGSGADAAHDAGLMKAKGAYYILQPKTQAL